jgi:hypothetical protein
MESLIPSAKETSASESQGGVIHNAANFLSRVQRFHPLRSSHPPSSTAQVRKSFPSMAPTNWSPENQIRLLLILLAHSQSKSILSHQWEAVAKLMGEGFTADAVRIQYHRTLTKKEAFIAAKMALGRKAASKKKGGPNTPSKKRKVVENIGWVKKEEND